MRNKTVLIIDDTKEIRVSLAEALSWGDFEPITAENGKEALEILIALQASDYPGLIILDLMMPIMNGYEFLSEIHTNHSNTLARIPLIVASAKANFELSLPDGVEFMRKPIDLDKFFEVVKRICTAES